jgi:UDP-N-acetylglucosamine--N-acetylmuramyl-(pentapeptide) pyrophosphoryl-undecaprenol N-acetylglucosamine transferase
VLRADRDAARKRYGIGPAERCLLVFGGSLGARSVNEAAVEAFGSGGEQRGFHVLHIAGHRDFPEMRRRLESTGMPGRYTLIEYEPSLAEPLAAADLVLARAGGSIFELAAAGRPAILVPYPHAAGRHQHANAAWMTDAGAAVVIEDADLRPETLVRTARLLLGNGERLAAMAAAARAIARPGAAQRIAAEILNACEQDD